MLKIKVDKKLIQDAVAEYLSDNFSIYVSPRDITFYEELGWQEVAERDIDWAEIEVEDE